MNLSFDYVELNEVLGKIDETGLPSRLHNTSIVHLHGSKYLLLCRFDLIAKFFINQANIEGDNVIVNGKKMRIEGSKDDEQYYGNKISYTPAKIVPGNDIECKNLNSRKWTLFWWNNWGNIYQKKNSDVRDILISEISIFVIWDVAQNKFIQTKKFIREGDIRLCKCDNHIIAYNSDMSKIYLIDEDGTIKKTITLRITSLLRDKNIQIIWIQNNIIDIFNWFTEKGIKLNKIYCDDDLFSDTLDEYVDDLNAIISECYILYTDQQYPILGTGSCLIDKNEDKAKKNYGIMPLFSFTTPHIALTDDRLMGVGHIKIHTNQTKYPYKANSNIDLFRKHLTEDMAQYGPRYIPHNGSTNKSDCEGYIYLMFFYIYDLRKSDFIISDAFCPLDFNAEYYFSLIFPMGIALSADNKTIYVTAGIGDYYAVILTFSYDEVVTSCTHSMLNLDLSTYHYYLAIVGKPVQYVKRLADYRQQGGRDYHKLYQKYKQKYLYVKEILKQNF